MKIIIAMDSFKGSLTACQACEIVAEEIAKSIPNTDIVIKPMADGGEGTATAMIKACNGQWIPQEVMGPCRQMKVKAGFAWFDSDKTALVEMASASGLELLSKDQADPTRTTTYGTGQLIKTAAEYGARKILLAVGGSATVDGGCGAAAALGWKLLDKNNAEIPLGGAGLKMLAKIVKPKNLNLPKMEVLCDVDNPLCGPSGAAKVFGPQKGANPQMVEQLEEGLVNLAALISIDNVPGAGAAGGLAAGAIAFMNAKLVSGIETIIARSNLMAELQSADWVITGEGSFDQQSLRGKVVSGIAKAALQYNTKVAVIAGQVKIKSRDYQQIGIITAIGCRTESMGLDYALKNCRNLLRSAAQKFTEKNLTQ